MAIFILPTLRCGTLVGRLCILWTASSLSGIIENSAAELKWCSRARVDTINLIAHTINMT